MAPFRALKEDVGQGATTQGAPPARRETSMLPSLLGNGAGVSTTHGSCRWLPPCPNGEFHIPEQALIQIGRGWVLAPDAWERCREPTAKYEPDENKIGLLVEARLAVHAIRLHGVGAAG